MKWAIVKPSSIRLNETSLVMYVYGDKRRAEEIACEMNTEENTNIYSVEYVETFDTKDTFSHDWWKYL